MPDSIEPYVTKLANGAYRISGTRVSLDSVIHAYWEGRLPQAIAADFPTLNLAQIHGTIAFYLSYREEVDRYLESQDRMWRQFQQESESRHGPLLQRIRQVA
jgi:uncharacterized protein (DUF433 family)